MRMMLDKVRDFLFSKKNREFLIFLFFFFISSTFWLMQTLNDTYEYELAIPLRIHDVPEKVVITSDVPSTVRFVVRDRGTVLVNYMFGQSFYPIVLSWDDYRSRGTRFTITNAELNKLIGGQLMASSRLVTIKPDHIDVIYTKGEGRKVPVRLAAEVNIPSRSYLASVRMAPDSVMIYAPEAQLDSIHEVFTESTSIQVEDSINVTLSLKAITGVKMIPSSVAVRYVTDVYSEKKVEVPVKGFDFPEGRSLKTFPARVTLNFQVGLSRFRQISADGFRVGIYYKELSSTGKATVRVVSHPEGVKNIRVEPAEVDYLIETLVP